MNDDAVPDYLNNPLGVSLTAFRRGYERQSAMSGGHSWQFFVGGDEDAPAILLLPMGGGDAELAFPYIMAWGRAYRVVAPEIPRTLRTVEEAITGLKGLLEGLGIVRAYVVGMAWGAQLAQIFIRRYPDSMLGAVFAHATLPNEREGERVRMQRNFMRVYPSFLLRAHHRRGMMRAIEGARLPLDEAERIFWRGYYGAMFAERWRKGDVMVRARLSLDFHEHHAFDARDVLRLEGEVLLIESDGDEVVGEGERGALKTMYPSAYVQTLEGYPHFAPVLYYETYLSSMTRFLQKDEL